LFCTVSLVVSSISSIVIGCVGGLFQNNIKRLFGYASVNQLGFLLAGLSVSNYFSFRVTIFYFFIYILVASTFLFTISLSYNESTSRTVEFLNELKNLVVISEGVSTEVPLHIIFLVSVFSMCGLPPLAGFFAKYFLMFEVLKGGYFSMVFFILLGSALSAFYYLKLIFQLVSYDSGFEKSDLSNDYYVFEPGYEFSTSHEKISYPILLVMDI
jgi:NADH-quinone oxidoreductase subunit N